MCVYGCVVVFDYVRVYVCVCVLVRLCVLRRLRVVVGGGGAGGGGLMIFFLYCLCAYMFLYGLYAWCLCVPLCVHVAHVCWCVCVFCEDGVWCRQGDDEIFFIFHFFIVVGKCAGMGADIGRAGGGGGGGGTGPHRTQSHVLVSLHHRRQLLFQLVLFSLFIF